ncbi:alpha/beta hydrolase [Actinomadura barringtoniae]|uniref:Alpha/beta hydrolase n=1 Tax=Actinomadura barringtoniae TaxID=1427535 RepID=A0A939P939_9ACTN|nr:alpha/beta hydrolase [Actinomadura barringtoniae]MBO2448048.1 alpha/beta hydrolase [Actinomadura barringtoniae]
MKIRVSGGEVAADVIGEGPPVVLTHGAPASSYLWREVARDLARTHTVHVWDLLGYGDSRATELPTIDLQARTLAELVDHWGLKDPALVGHDIGGATTLRAHLVHQAPARRLALLDAAVLDPWITPFTLHMQRYQDAYRTMPHHVFDEIITTRLRTAAHNPMTPETLAAYHAPWSGDDGQQRWIDQVVGTTPDHTRDIAARLTQLNVPTLILWGDNDEWLEPATADRLAAAIPGARKATISGAGHFLPEDNPHDTAAALRSFLN